MSKKYKEEGGSFIFSSAIKVKKVLECKECLTILLLLRQCPMHFSMIHGLSGLTPAKINNALKILRKGFWIIPKTVPSVGNSLLVEYKMSKRGKKLFELLSVLSYPTVLIYSQPLPNPIVITYPKPLSK